jgi:hypothetical protein
MIAVLLGVAAVTSGYYLVMLLFSQIIIHIISIINFGTVVQFQDIAHHE